MNNISTYPDWAQELSNKYYTKTLSQFILYGNVRDFVKLVQSDGKISFDPLRKFFAEALFGGRDLVIFYDRGSGVYFLDAEMRKDFNRALTGYDTMMGTEFAKAMPKDPTRVFTILDNYIRLRIADNKRIALIIDYAETIIPVGDISHYTADDRNALVWLKKWAHDPTFLKSDLTICLIAENLAEINQSVVQSPYTAEIHIRIPNETERLEFIRYAIEGKPFADYSEVSPELLAKSTAGLNRIQLQNILAESLENKKRLTMDYLSERKKELIEAECYGLLEFVEPPYHLEMVAGHEAAKKKLKDAATAIRMGRYDVLPMGYLVSGPVGTGKTFLIYCFAGEIGVPVVKLKNFRSQWQGVTEGNLEKILNMLKAIYPVGVMIDEADAYLGDRSSAGDSGVSNRVFAQIASFMGNTEYRGKIIWFLITCRPDLLPIDLKRQGRAEEHIALFYPQTKEEREMMFRVMKKKAGVKTETEETPSIILDDKYVFSGADMEAALVRANFRAAVEGKEKITHDDLSAVFKDFIPPTYPLEIELQNLVAVLECTSREQLPGKFRDLQREEIVAKVEQLKATLEES
jgi:AAA+ superfamily predicted ATPase